MSPINPDIVSRARRGRDARIDFPPGTSTSIRAAARRADWLRQDGLHHLKAIGARRARGRGRRRSGGERRGASPLLPADAIVVATAAELFERARPDVVHIVTPPPRTRRWRARDQGRVPRLRRETVHADQGRSRGDLRRWRRARWCAPGTRWLFEPPRWRARGAADIGRVVHVESYFSFKMVRRTITPVEQAKDILPHAVYPLVEQLRAGTGMTDAIEIPASTSARRRRVRPAASWRGDRGDDGDAQRPARRAVPEHHRHQRVAPRRLHRRIGHAAARAGNRAGCAPHAVPPGVPDAQRRDARHHTASAPRRRFVSGSGGAHRWFLRQHPAQHGPDSHTRIDHRYRQDLRTHRSGARCGRAGRRARGERSVAGRRGNAAWRQAGRTDGVGHRRHGAAWEASCRGVEARRLQGAGYRETDAARVQTCAGH